MLNHVRNAFTLVELSITLLIISLIIGGIIVGKAIFDNSRIISVIAEVNQYRTAITQFKNQYNALPGDITNASSFWPDCTSSVASTYNGGVGDGGSCNGNGDGIIGIGTNNTTILAWSTNYNQNENLRAWQHLSLAKIISGSYSGYGYGGIATGKFDFNTPKSKYSNSGYSFFGSGCYNNGYNVYLTLSNTIVASSISNSYSITPSDAYVIDTKIDDGNPKTGNAISSSSDISENCQLQTTPLACINGTNSTYYTANQNNVCLIYFKY